MPDLGFSLGFEGVPFSLFRISFPQPTMRTVTLLFLIPLLLLGCKPNAPVESQTPTTAQLPTPPAPPPSTTGGFDGARAFEHVRNLVALGPRPPASDAIHKAQAYISSQLRSFGCDVQEDDFHAATPIGDLLMKNIVAKIPGTSPNIVLLSTHYDTVRLPNFVGADDGGSGTGTMLELARVLCPQKNKFNVWIAFFDGEEAQGNWTDNASIQWTDTNNTYGSRELAARMALSGDLPKLKAMILADMIGPSNLKIKRDTDPEHLTAKEPGSTLWLIDLVWGTAASLGYSNNFVNENYLVGGDDHYSFIQRGVAGCDLIDFSVEKTYWHTPQDTLDKIDPRSLAIVGHVLLQAIPALEKKFR
jgi:glutaminyl-peptide cyclotransferase